MRRPRGHEGTNAVAPRRHCSLRGFGGMNAADLEGLERLADLVAARIIDRLGTTTEPGLIDAAEVARRYGLSRSTVYGIAPRLGAVRVGSRVRFHPDRVEAALGDGREAELERP